MTMPQMQKAMSGLRLLLAAARAKDEEFEAAARQFRRQLERAPRYAVQGGNPIDATLNMMGEIQERLNQVEERREHLASIRRQAEAELQALNITFKIAEAKDELAGIRVAAGAGGDADTERAAELERFIQDASEQAAQAITGDFIPPSL